MINLTSSIESLEWEELYPGIICYRNMLKDPVKAYEIMKNSEESGNGKYFLKEWDAWSKFGTYSSPKDEDKLLDAEKGSRYDEEKQLNDEIFDAYQKTISHYFNNITIDRTLPKDAYFSGHSYCKYFNNIDNLKNNMTMQYHTDYIIAEKEAPGPKFHTTCTFYINDNYDGGDIEFYVNGDIINHKPKAGDIIVFPSDAPFFHGVKTIPTGNKFFVRNFVMFDYAGSPEWMENQMRYGAHRWSLIENKRLEDENKKTMIYFKNDKLISYEEAYANVEVKDEN